MDIVSETTRQLCLQLKFEADKSYGLNTKGGLIGLRFDEGGGKAYKMMGPLMEEMKASFTR